MGTPVCGCIATFSIVPKLNAMVSSLFCLATVMVSRIASIVLTDFPPMDSGNEFLSVDCQRGILAAGVDGRQSSSWRR